ncbi:MAG: hypothetical protein OCD01_19025 [Fibrobacterales bacterium]
MEPNEGERVVFLGEIMAVDGAITINLCARECCPSQKVVFVGGFIAIWCGMEGNSGGRLPFGGWKYGSVQIFV